MPTVADERAELRYNPYHGKDGRFTSKNNFSSSIDNSSKADIIKLEDILIGKSLGAKSQNYDVMDLATGEKFNFVEGTRLQNVEVFAGKGVKKAYEKAFKYADKYGGKTEDWQHVKGFGILDVYGEERKAEVHWSQCEGIGKHEFFIKEWLDD